MAKTTREVPAVPIDIEIERWPIERLVPRSNNPRTHNREQVAGIAASLREYGRGDCTDAAVVSRLPGDAKPSLMITDPP